MSSTSSDVISELPSSSRIASHLSTQQAQGDYSLVLARYKVVETVEYECTEEIQAVRNHLVQHRDALSGMVSVLKRPWRAAEGVRLSEVQPELYTLLKSARFSYRGEAFYTSFVRLSIDAVFADRAESRWGLATDEHDAISEHVLSSFNLVSLIPVVPDRTVGLGPESIQIRKDESSSPLNGRTEVFVVSRSEKVLCSLSGMHTCPSWYPWILIEDKCGRGMMDKGRLQNHTAKRVALQIYVNLWQQASRADPDNCMPLSSMARRVYGLRTFTNVWEIDMMVFDDSNFNVVPIFTADLLDPSSMLQMICVLKSIREERRERYITIGNWLWCLRDKFQPLLQPGQATSVRGGKKGRSSHSTGVSPYARPTQAGPTPATLLTSSLLHQSHVHGHVTKVEKWLQSVIAPLSETPKSPASNSNHLASRRRRLSM
ncbi:hypothetical protein I204_04985 [Kwoniella mangroviensis CBS 8886]|nr:hypothetical protein I204_04985 [Kwoniella mangroviensis CBS 8886]